MIIHRWQIDLVTRTGVVIVADGDYQVVYVGHELPRGWEKPAGAFVFEGELAERLYLALAGHRYGDDPPWALDGAAAREQIEEMGRQALARVGNPTGMLQRLRAREVLRAAGPGVRPYLGMDRLDFRADVAEHLEKGGAIVIP